MHDYIVTNLTSGTISFSEYSASEGLVVVTAVEVSMFRDLNPYPVQKRVDVQPEVIESLERSIRDHGDVWAELSKH